MQHNKNHKQQYELLPPDETTVCGFAIFVTCQVLNLNTIVTIFLRIYLFTHLSVVGMHQKLTISCVLDLEHIVLYKGYNSKICGLCGSI